jgi:flagellar biosynthesis/type III secretory pathway M-ring protein FliF/YscJ
LAPARLAILAAVGVFVVAGVGTAAFYLNRPAFQPIYIGLERDDISRMGMALADAGIEYDVNTDGTSILVPAGKTSRARMILAEKGLPNSSGTGYELFDNLGSLGLTAFMQEVTRVRALEGEISRSIQTIRGVKGARVHIVLADRGNFRFAEQTPTASVVVRYEGAHAEASAMSIRHLVSAAVPGLQAENVTVLDASGRLLAAGDDPLNNTATSNLGIKATVENEVADSVYKALAPYLGNMNFRVSVQADINTDQKQVEETIFDPESRVERSVQVVRSEDASSQQTGNIRRQSSRTCLNSRRAKRRPELLRAQRTSRGNHELRAEFQAHRDGFATAIQSTACRSPSWSTRIVSSRRSAEPPIRRRSRRSSPKSASWRLPLPACRRARRPRPGDRRRVHGRHRWRAALRAGRSTCSTNISALSSTPCPSSRPRFWSSSWV